ncbi:hypothetical protein K501DRAFT_198199 [Backusella circina FSU 941]|nr:hypothetical protein K501DRAFT_198199 [Backusella circina FSU 941]
MTTRAELLNSYPTKTQFILKIPDQDCSTLQDQCDKIATETNTSIRLIAPIPQSSFASQNTVNIQITGIPENVELARVQTLIMLDKECKSEVNTLTIPYKLHHLICGRKRTGLQSILEETPTSIYFPSPFIVEAEDDYSPPIFITGQTGDIARVKESMEKLATLKAKSMYQKDAVLNPRKLDWMSLHCRNDLRKMMRDNGSFIEFPKMGSGSNRVKVFAESRVNAERTLRSLHFLACGIYEACFYFNHRDGAIYGADPAHAFFNSIANITNLVSQLSLISGAEVAYKTDPGCIQVYGTERAIRNVYQRLHEMSFLKMFHQSTVFNVELSNEQREFISGKKSGKINKIMKTSGARIKFVPFSEYNFIIEVESNSFNKALDGLTLLEEELPAEISFHVPEVYHKRIIGVGGKNIQRIMKKYGVYVKFSNAEEFAALGGYYDNEDNVVARTPMKNQINLDNLRHAVMELINPKDRDCVDQVLHDVPFWLHRTLVSKQASALAEMTRKTNTIIIWPDHELANDFLTLVGPESQVGVAAHMVQSIVPETYNVHLPKSALLSSVLASDEFTKMVTHRLENDLQVKLVYNASLPEKREQVIKLQLTKANMDQLEPALCILIDYLKSHKVEVYEDSHLVRSIPLVPINSAAAVAAAPGAMESAFPLFQKTLGMNTLPTPSLSDRLGMTTDGLELISPSASSSASLMMDLPPPNTLKSYSLFDYPNSTSANPLDASWKSFRDMNSPRTADNIRAIFDSSPKTKPPVPLVTPLSFRNGASNTNPNTMDIWSNPPSMMNAGFTTTSPPLTGLESKPNHSMMYVMDQTNSTPNGFYPSLPKSHDFHSYIVPTSSTSTGSNNSSMHSGQSMNDLLDESRRGESPPQKTAFSSQPPVHTQSPLIYPTKAVQFALSPSSSSSTHMGGPDKHLEFPALFSQNHSSADETVIVQSLLNSMSLGQPNHLAL